MMLDMSPWTGQQVVNVKVNLENRPAWLLQIINQGLLRSTDLKNPEKSHGTIERLWQTA